MRKSGVSKRVTRGDELLHKTIETVCLSKPTRRVTFERDEGQEYAIGARVAVHPMNSLFRTVDLDPSHGSYQVTRCERVCDVGWKALRISLDLVTSARSAAPLSPMVADDHR